MQAQPEGLRTLDRACRKNCIRTTDLFTDNYFTATTPVCVYTHTFATEASVFREISGWKRSKQAPELGRRAVEPALSCRIPYFSAAVRSARLIVASEHENA